MSDDRECYFCGISSKVDKYPRMDEVYRYQCNSCGVYVLDDMLEDDLPKIKERENKCKIACVLNERRLKGLKGIALSDVTNKNDLVCNYPQISIDDILDEFPQKTSDFINRILLNLDRLAKRPFEGIKLEVEMAHLLLFTSDQEECNSILRELEQEGFIRFHEVKRGPQLLYFFLTTKFGERIENLQKIGVDNKRAFVAMWFDESMDAYYEDGIEKAIIDAGYEPIKIDLQEFNEKICDEIIAEIKRTKFMIADFSKMRSAVFFEAGFAKGLGREVICTVMEEDIEALKEHFDTRQYNHIVYTSPEDLRKKLYNRICATIV